MILEGSRAEISWELKKGTSKSQTARAGQQLWGQDSRRHLLIWFHNHKRMSRNFWGIQGSVVQYQRVRFRVDHPFPIGLIQLLGNIDSKK